GATPFMGMLGAFFAFLHRFTERSDLVLGANIINRHRPELEPLLGFFVDNLVMRVDLGDSPDFSTVLRRVRDGALGAFAPQALPFELLVEELSPERALGHNPLFQVMFAWVRSTALLPSSPELAIVPLDTKAQSARFDLTLFVEDHGDRLTAR